MEGDARRQAWLASMNEGEDEEAAQAFAAASGQPSAPKNATAAAAQRALNDPTYMLELMRQSNDLQAAKRQRLQSLMMGAGAGGSAGCSAPGDDAPSRPRNYKQERAAREREEL